MILHFYLRYSTQFGQTVFVSGDTTVLGNDDAAKAFPLEYLDTQWWHGQAEISEEDAAEPLRYKYLIRQNDGPDLVEFGDDRIIEPSSTKTGKIMCIDTWNHPGTIENVFFSSAFQDVLLQPKKQKQPTKTPPGKKKKYTHEFKVKAPLLHDDEMIAIGGSAVQLNEWSTGDVLPLIKEGNWWIGKIDLTDADFPVTYKYAVCKSKDGSFVRFEEGHNRILLGDATEKKTHHSS